MPTFAKVTDPKRAEKWREVFETDEVPIVSPIPGWHNLPGFDEPQLVYMLDFRAVTPEARARLVQQTAERFGLDTAVVDANLEHEGMPILAADVLMTCTDLGTLMNLLIDDLDDTVKGTLTNVIEGDDDWLETWNEEEDW